MPVTWLIPSILLLALIGYWAGRARALAVAGGDTRALHSLPGHHGGHVALFASAPALALLVVWLLTQPFVINARVAELIPDSATGEGPSAALMMSEVRRVAAGLDLAVREGVITAGQADSPRTGADDMRAWLAGVGVALGGETGPWVLPAAQRYRALSATGHLMMTIAVIALSAAGLAGALRRVRPQFRARDVTERAVKAGLFAAASIAILTTLGIVLSLVFNTIEFLRLYPAVDFFFGLTWAPSFGGGSELGILPLLWGTLSISVIALAVATPIGLFAAVYLSEYATPAIRAFAKPLLEVLAGIPTTVYGLFALQIVGPLLVSAFGEGGVLGVTWMGSGTAAMTAGLVLGVMLIPFISSLSDDIINAVPQTLRDGSLSLGATRSETIRQVVLPAALPGIAGAILLAASRAIGETMIVVLGAGAAARLSLNPFEAMTTITAKIVSQLTGDTDFSSPEALVAFALGMTLFVLTLALNALALYIVRTYREQYE